MHRVAAPHTSSGFCFFFALIMPLKLQVDAHCCTSSLSMHHQKSALRRTCVPIIRLSAAARRKCEQPPQSPLTPLRPPPFNSKID